MSLIRITGSQLHAARVLVGLSREDLAGRAGLCRHSIRKWETSSHAIPGAMYGDGRTKLRVLLTHRKLLQSKAIAIENDLRATLRNFGLKVGMIGTVKFETRIRELVENLPDLAALVEPLLIVRRVVREQLGILHRRLLAIVRDDDVCRRQFTHD